MFAVHYADGRTAYMRVSPEAARHGNMVVIDVARERQESGDLPGGTIIGVKQVRLPQPSARQQRVISPPDAV